MLRTLDRYIIRETLAPFGLTLLILTFLLQIPTIMDVAEKLIAKGVTLPIIGRILLTLIPSSLALTIPISLLVGLLIALGRLSADREAVAMQACGVSLYRILLIIALVGWTTVARLVRGATLSVRERDYVRAAVALGAGPVRIATRHILPNVVSPIIVALQALKTFPGRRVLTSSIGTRERKIYGGRRGGRPEPPGGARARLTVGR